MIFQGHDEHGLFERRSIARTKITRGALLSYDRKAGAFPCGICDITNVGAGLRLQNLKFLPVTFDLSFDKFHTARACVLIWRQGDFLGVKFQR